jgi:CheY-like chemotaxis protein
MLFLRRCQSGTRLSKTGAQPDNDRHQLASHHLSIYSSPGPQAIVRLQFHDPSARRGFRTNPRRPRAAVISVVRATAPGITIAVQLGRPLRGICVAGFNDVSHFHAISVLRGNRGIHTAVKFRHTILVVDDDPTFRDLYSTALRFRGFNVVTASDGLNALRAVEQDVPSLIILDLNMPCVDGSSVLRELAAHDETRAVPVIVVTGADTDRAALQASAILRKPVLPEHVLPFIERELHEQSAGRQMSCEREVNQKSR